MSLQIEDPAGFQQKMQNCIYRLYRNTKTLHKKNPKRIQKRGSLEDSRQPAAELCYTSPIFLAFLQIVPSNRTPRGLLLTSTIVITSLLLINTWAVPQPKQNVCITLAKAIKQDTLCLSLAHPDDPFSTCLAGLPADVWPITNNVTGMKDNNPNGLWKHSPVDAWDLWNQELPHASLEPQELEILGSVKMDFCVRFSYKPKWEMTERPTNIKERKIIRKDVSPYHPAYKNQSQRCNYTSSITSWSSNHPLQFPQGMFLICGDRE